LAPDAASLQKYPVTQLSVAFGFGHLANVWSLK